MCKGIKNYARDVTAQGGTYTLKGISACLLIIVILMVLIKYLAV
jgi:hypothetical protein